MPEQGDEGSKRREDDEDAAVQSQLEGGNRDAKESGDTAAPAKESVENDARGTDEAPKDAGLGLSDVPQPQEGKIEACSPLHLVLSCVRSGDQL